jgi:F420H(2)-dependent quinone reductase
MTAKLQDFSREHFCYLTTVGRVSGRSHTIEIWFALNGHTLYMLSEGRDKADWVKNAILFPHVLVRIKDTVFPGQARLAKDTAEDALARRLIANKYESSDGQDPNAWYNSALPLAVDLVG